MAISRKGMRRIVVDGVEYHWRAGGDAYSSMHPSLMIVEGSVTRGVYGQGAPRTIHAAFPYRLPHDQPGWWHELRVTVMPKLVEQTIRIAQRHSGNTTLTVAEVLELLDLDRPRVEDRLRDFEIALSARPFGALIPAILALGCHGDRGELVDDWFVCHSEELLRARLTFQQHADSASTWSPLDGPHVRSALAFLADACGRVGIEMPLDTGALDARLLGAARARAPWGIPPHHDWWQTE